MSNAWAFRNRVGKGAPIVVSVGEIRFQLFPDGQIPEALWKADFEREERDFLGRYLKAGMHVVNVGANVGLYAIAAAKLVTPAGVVHAFEPSRQSFDRLVRNLALNDCLGVRANQCALWSDEGSLMLSDDPRNTALDGHRFVTAIRSPDAASTGLALGEVVACRTLDKYLDSVGEQGVDCAIIDVEGAELDVLLGMARTLRQFKPLLVLECTKNQGEVGRLLRSEGYTFWVPRCGRLFHASFESAVATGNVIAMRAGACQARDSCWGVVGSPTEPFAIDLDGQHAGISSPTRAPHVRVNQAL